MGLSLARKAKESEVFQVVIYETYQEMNAQYKSRKRIQYF